MSEQCPINFNFDPATFKEGDMVSFRMEAMGDFPFAGILVAVHDAYVDIVVEGEPGERYRASRTSRPMVSASPVETGPEA